MSRAQWGHGYHTGRGDRALSDQARVLLLVATRRSAYASVIRKLLDVDKLEDDARQIRDALDRCYQNNEESIESFLHLLQHSNLDATQLDLVRRETAWGGVTASEKVLLGIDVPPSQNELRSDPKCECGRVLVFGTSAWTRCVCGKSYERVQERRK